MGKKSLGKDYLTINEFAELVGISASALRHYDKTGAFKPEKYGNDFENKYRYYSPMQITTVKMIRVLTEIGVPLSKIKELTKNRTPEELLKLLNKQKNIIADELIFLQEAHTLINAYMNLLNAGLCADETEFSVSEMP